VSFTVHHLGIQMDRGRDFLDISGQFVVDRQAAASSVDVTVGMAHRSSPASHAGNERLRVGRDLASDVRRYPQMTYHSSHIEMGEQHRSSRTVS